MNIAKSTINKIKENADIVEVVSDFIALTKKGANYTCLSPFSDEKTPSFSVSPSKQMYKCFSTQKGGDVVSFVMELGSMTFVEAIQYLGKKYNITIAQGTAEDQKKYKEQQSINESVLIALKFANNHFQSNLAGESKECLKVVDYLMKERQFSSDTIAKFELGYSTSVWGSLSIEAEKQNYKLEILEKAGLIGKKDNKTYDRFYDRVMFPIHDIFGRVIAFGGRTLDKSIKVKYINSPETPVYNKSNVLYGFYQAQKAIRKQDQCFLVEGYTDVVSMHQSGIENVVSASGTAISKSQLLMIKRVSNELILLFDADTAGVKAALKGIEIALELDMSVHAISFPEKEDPDSYARKYGKNKLKTYLKENKQDIVSFYVSCFIEQVKDDSFKKGKLIIRIAELIAKIPTEVQRDFFYKKASELLACDIKALKNEVKKRIQRVTINPKKVNMPSGKGSEAPKEAPKKARYGRVRTYRQSLIDANNAPPSNPVFYNMINEDDCVILYADKGAGKTILAIMLAISFSEGASILDSPVAPKAQKVLYVDFEMRDSQRFKRSTKNSVFETAYPFNDNLLLWDINKEAVDFTVDRVTGASKDIDLTLTETGAKVMIFDNITSFTHGGLEDSKQMGKILNMLNVLQIKHGLTMIILGHTTKVASGFASTDNNLAGSKLFANLVDGIIFLGKSVKSSNHRYLITHKCRDNSFDFTPDNILPLYVNKPDNLLILELIKDSEGNVIEEPEKDHYLIGEELTEYKESEVIRLYEEALSEGNKKGRVRLEKETGVSQNRIRRILIEHENAKKKSIEKSEELTNSILGNNNEPTIDEILEKNEVLY